MQRRIAAHAPLKMPRLSLVTLSDHTHRVRRQRPISAIDTRQGTTLSRNRWQMKVGVGVISVEVTCGSGSCCRVVSVPELVVIIVPLLLLLQCLHLLVAVVDIILVV